jgi:hypothetical protein
MQLTLSPEEAGELRELVAAAISDLRSEIHHTDAPEYRGSLQRRQRVLQRLLEQFAEAEAGAP